jgi:phospholipid-binding lipoprotein MlaA
MRARRLSLILPGLLAAALASSGCTVQAVAPGAVQAAGAEEFNDPLEETNRAIFGFNQAADRAIILPAAKTYRTVVPPPMQQSIHDFLQNLNNPVIFANDVLQGQVGLAGQTLARTAINTTIGFGGMFDVAKTLGIPHHSNDMGITLATWGMAEGPYIMMPILGPSNPRDIVGSIADGFADPGDYVAGQHHLYYAILARRVTSGIDVRSRNIENLADIEKTALDYYATIRSLHRQRRAAQVRHEQSDLPNPTPVQGGDAGPNPAISYFLAQTPQVNEVPLK